MIGLATADVALTFRVIVNDIPAFLRSGTPGDLRNHLRLKSILFVTDKQVVCLNFSTSCLISPTSSIGDGLLVRLCSLQVSPVLIVTNGVPSCIDVSWFGKDIDLIKSSRSWSVPCLPLIQVSLFLGSHECFSFVTVWGYLAAATDGLDFERAITPLYLWSVFAFNISITAITGNPRNSLLVVQRPEHSLTAGRIWWLARLSRLLGKQSVRSYNITIAILSVISTPCFSTCL